MDHEQPSYLEERGIQARVAELEQEVAKLRDVQTQASLLAAIIGPAGDAIVGQTISGVVQIWNAGAERLYGYRASEMIGRDMAGLLPADRAEEESIILGRLTRGERISPFQTSQNRIAATATASRDCKS